MTPLLQLVPKVGLLIPTLGSWTSLEKLWKDWKGLKRKERGQGTRGKSEGIPFRKGKHAIKPRLFSCWFQFRFGHDPYRVASQPFFLQMYVLYGICKPQPQSLPVVSAIQLDTTPSQLLFSAFFKLSLDKFKTIFLTSLNYLSCV